jgi:hypothetical protein
LDVRVRARTAWRNRRALTRASAIAVLGALALPGSAAAADKAVRLTLDASNAACTAFDQIDCSYIEMRNGNAPAPDPADPAAAEPTFLNLHNLPRPATIDGTIHDDGTFTVADGDVDFPTYSTLLANPLVGDVTVRINLVQTGAWTGTFDTGTGQMALSAPQRLEFRLSCNAADTSHALCGAVFGPAGNMGTWQVDGKAPVELTTGHLGALAPPVAYGADWVGPVAEDGSPLDADSGRLTLIANTPEFEHVDPTSCVDAASAACTNPVFGGLVVASINESIGGVWDSANAANTKDTVPGAVDHRMTFVMSDPPALETDSQTVDFGTQPLGTVGATKSIELTAFDAGDVPVADIYTDGGDDDFWVVRDGCRGPVPAGDSCTLKLRFAPSAGGARSTTVYALVENPVTGQEETLTLASLTGRGAGLPQGPAGPAGLAGVKGDTGATGPQARSVAATLAIKRGKSKLALGPRGRALVARIACEHGRCTVTRSAAWLRVRGKSLRIPVRVSRSIAEGTSATAMVVLGRGARNALRKAGRGIVKVSLAVKSSDGTKASRTIWVTVRPKR